MLPIEQLYEDMQPVLQASRPADALQALQNVVRSFPDFTRAHSDIGTLYYQAGEKQAALQHYEQALRCSRDNVTVQKNLADFYYVEMARSEEALSLYAQVIRQRPNDAGTLMTAAHILVSLRRFDEADAYYRKVIEIEPWNADAAKIHQQLVKIGGGGNGSRKAEDIYAEFKQVIDRGDVPAGRRMLEKLLELHPKFALAHNDLGVLCYHAGEKGRAVGYYEAAVGLQPDNPTFLKNLADFYFIEQQRVEDALRCYVAVLEKSPEDIETLMTTGHICVSLQHLEDARVFYNRVLEIEPWNAEARRSLEKPVHVQTTRPAAQRAEVLHAVASRQAGAGDIQGALDTLGQLVVAFPDFALGQNDLGVLFCRAGDFSRALRHSERAVELEPGSVTFKRNLAELYWVKMGRIKDALGQYVDILSVQPEDVETLLATGKICVALKQIDDARVFFDRVLEIEPWNSAARQSIGELQGVSCAA